MEESSGILEEAANTAEGINATTTEEIKTNNTAERVNTTTAEETNKE